MHDGCRCVVMCKGRNTCIKKNQEIDRHTGLGAMFSSALKYLCFPSLSFSYTDFPPSRLLCVPSFPSHFHRSSFLFTVFSPSPPLPPGLGLAPCQTAPGPWPTRARAPCSATLPSPECRPPADSRSPTAAALSPVDSAVNEARHGCRYRQTAQGHRTGGEGTRLDDVMT